MPTVTITEAQLHLSELIDRLQPDESIVITRSGVPVARLLAEPAAANKPRVPGSAQGLLTIVKEDDEHLKDFEEYLR
jgi:prevent-host-death family protein